jgi:hypothetical protein
MPLADLEDINVHLPDDKLEVDTARYAPFQLDAERIVRGYLSGYVDSSTLATWSSPDATPEIIRAVTGRLVAAFYYRERYSEDSLEDPWYPQIKYNEAIDYLNQIRSGTMEIEGVVSTTGDHMSEENYYPNDSAPGPVFLMEGMYRRPNGTIPKT